MLYINPNSRKLKCLGGCNAPVVPGEQFCQECLAHIQAFAGPNAEALKAHILGTANTSIHGGAESPSAIVAIPSPGGEGQGEGGLSAQAYRSHMKNIHAIKKAIVTGKGAVALTLQPVYLDYYIKVCQRLDRRRMRAYNLRVGGIGWR